MKTLLTGLSLLVSIASFAQTIPNFEFCSIKCISVDDENQVFEGVDMDYSRVGQAICSKAEAQALSLANCAKSSARPETCSLLEAPCEIL